METCSTEIIKKKLIPMTIKENNITGTKYPRLVLSIIGDSRTFVPKPWLTPVFQLGLIETAKGANDCLILYEGSEEKISTLVREAVQNFRVLKKDDDKTFISFVRIRSPLFEEETGSNAVQNMDKEDEICFTLKGDDYVELLSNISREYVPLVELGQDNNLKMPVLVIVAEGESATIELVVNLVECCIPVLVLKGSGKAADLIADCLDDSSAINLKASLLLGTFIHSGEMAVLKNHMRKIRKKKQFVNVLDISTQDETQFPEAVSNAIIRAWAQGGTDKPVISDNTDLMKVKTTEPDKIYESTRNGNQDVPEVISPTEMSDGTFLPALNIGSENYNVDTSDAFDNSLNNKPGCSSVVKPNGKSRKNRINPKSVTLHNAKMGGEVKQFMTKYQESLTPASLPLYFYIAYQFIQEMSNKDDKRQNFQILLKQALVANRVDYVAVLLQEDKVEFDMQYFPYIYNEVLRCSCINAKNKGDCQHMWSILEGASPASSRLLLPEINEKSDQKEKYQKRIQAGRQLCQKFLHYPRKSYKAEDFEAVEDRNTRCEMDRDMFQDLLIWAIFCNRRELATLFWSKCPNQLETAVLASCVLKRMATIARSGKDQFLYNSIKEHAVLFEKRSIELQTVLYNEDSEIAMELVMADCTVWNIKVNPLECAHDNTMYDFIAHSCAQRRLNTIWYNKIGATLGEFWWNGFFCGCKTIGERGKTSMLLPKFIFAPLTRFIIHYILFIGALVCFSAFLMIELSEFEGLQSIKFYESVLYIWLLGDMVEEYRGVISWNNERISNRFSNEDGIALSQTISYRLKKYLFNFWNALDVFSYIITIAAILIRFLMKSSYDDIGTSNYTTGAKTARRSYSLSLFTMYMRFLHATLMSRKLGPKILMIKEMLKDLFRFIGILFVFMVGIGVLYHANMYPAHEDMWNSKDWTYWRIWKIMYIPYWQIYGELFLNEFQANSTTPCTTNQSEWEKNPDVERCNEYDWVLIVIAALYLLVSNLLLVNLVIALFSYRFEMVQANSERLWRYWRYTVIMDYRTRIPAPLNLVIRPFMLIGMCMKKCNNFRRDQDPNRFKQEIARMKKLQDISAFKCIRSTKTN